MNHFGKLVRLNGLGRKSALIGSRGGSAVSICSLNRWRSDLLNYTNSKSPAAGRAALRILPARSPKPTAEPGFAADTRSQISDADRLGSQTVRQLAAQPPAAEGRGLAREGEVPPPVALVQATWARGLALPDASGSSLGAGSSLATSDASRSQLVVFA